MSKYIVALMLAGLSAGFIGMSQQPAPVVKTAAVQQTSPASGAQMYATYCASCHGAKGMGDGPVAQALKTPPINLTTLSAKNGGVFPFEHVSAVLKFGVENPAHGSPEMPVWGDLMRTLQPTDDKDNFVRLRIYNLTEYLKQIQKK